MTEDAPILGLTGQELFQYAQLINALIPLLQRLRAHRERAGRLAHEDAEHAALQHEARQHPPIRLMRDEELAEWQRRVPAALAAQQPGERVGVWSARLIDAQGGVSGEWGLEAHTWDERGAATATLFAVCRDAEDALAMTQHLREQGSPEHLAELHDLADRAHGQFVQSPVPTMERGAAVRSGTVLARRAAVSGPLVLGETEWASALRRVLPPRVADAVVVTDPTHPHYSAWQELHELANEEVLRVGADPQQLAALVRAVPQWREDVRNPPALAHWAITHSRTHPQYEQRVGARAQTRSAGLPIDAEPDQTRRPQRDRTGPRSTSVSTAAPSARLRLTEVRHPHQARMWAHSLDSTNAQHRIEAKTGFGRWGAEVDAILATKFRGLTATTKAAAKQARGADQDAAAILLGDVQDAQVDPTDSISSMAAPKPDPAIVQGYADDIERFDPGKAIDRRAAHIMLGRIDPEIDRLIAEKFSDDPKIVDKVEELYPDGLPEAAAWRNRAAAEEAVASAERAIPGAAERADADAAVTAVTVQEVAAQQRGIAATVAGTQSPIVRRVIQTTRPTTGPARRA